MKKDNLGDRMKSNYENRSKTSLLRRTPIIIRLDGKAFHTFTRGLQKPYDTILMKTMQETMLYLCENIQGCKIGYTQSDEITLLITDYDTLSTDAWYDYEVQKLCSVSASMATLAFNKRFEENVLSIEDVVRYKDKFNKAMFDARCFNIPKEEVCNCFIWRQQDATRNAIQLLGQNYFSPKELHKKSCNDIQDMLMVQKGMNFNDERTDFKRGSCCYKNGFICESNGITSKVKIKDTTKDASTWIIDKEIPIFTQDRCFIEKFVYIEKE